MTLPQPARLGNGQSVVGERRRNGRPVRAQQKARALSLGIGAPSDNRIIDPQVSALGWTSALHTIPAGNGSPDTLITEKRPQKTIKPFI
ncbi:hypothetical protein [Phaeobacter sp. J2-8]|uniref:hypothetical protein n=1 Tax=Phaeobacter sp. J2-8 TaxID=2931394 RepID=UPI001FD0B6C1|nr:hypothetical protein [Phaeobacter sp. J2-8]MCJ7871939.1 hypothetical protein [Phaeobacter sp. J2-8]